MRWKGTAPRLKETKRRRKHQSKGTVMAARKQGTNRVQQLREDQLLSKAELARRAGVSPLTINRIERGETCRVDTKRKIILALGLKLSDKEMVFTDVSRRRR